jgi:signal transduction histidine kinase
MADPAPTTSRWHRWLHPLHSVRVRITLAAVLVTAVAVGTAGWLLVRSVENAQIRQLRHDINASLDQIASRLRDGEDPQEAVDAVVPTATLGSVTVYDERGQVAGTAPAHGGGTMTQTMDANAPRDEAPPDGADAVGGMKTGSGETIVAPLETVTRTVETPTGDLTVTASTPVDQMADTVDTLRRALFVGLPALIALVATIAFVLVGRALRPVEAIRAEVDEITGSTMHRRVPEPPTSDEIGRLARTMNAMLGRLDATATRQRQFVADASHELRSPVAAIRTCLEVARRKADRANWLAVADTALTEESRLEALLDDMLLLAAHDENSASAPTTAPVDLAALASAEAQRPRRVPVHVDRPAAAETLMTSGAADELARAVSNLVDNAARYATTAVHIGLGSQNDTVGLIVDDDGPGIPPADRERIFERFTRLDDSRARHEGGSGLGLAVVRSILTRHRGRVRAEDNPKGGARFVIELPARRTTPGTRNQHATPATSSA